MSENIYSETILKISPCPYCGGKGELTVEKDERGFEWHRIDCSGCGYISWAFPDDETAIAAWNYEYEHCSADKKAGTL